MNTKKLKKSAALITGTLVAGSFSVSANANQANLFEYDNLGSGAELRSELIEMNSARYKTFEMKCGGEKSDKDSKTSEANCGAEDKKAEKSDSTKKAKNAEAKCGEGKCGGDAKEAKKDTTKKESKAAQSKCGQGKCGVE